MRSGSSSRFEAQTFGRLATINEGKRFEMHFSDAEGREIVVTLPLPAAVELGCIICDVSEHAPYLMGGISRPTGAKRG